MESDISDIHIGHDPNMWYKGRSYKADTADSTSAMPTKLMHR